MSPLLKQRLRLAALSIAMIASAAESRDLRRMCIQERVAASDAVFVGKVLALAEPEQETAGVNKYAIVQVQDTFKGSLPERVNFVVSGYSAESNPACCEPGDTYIFFSRRGHDVFELSGDGIVATTLGKDRYLSATNGKFSTFLVRGDQVTHWEPGPPCGDSMLASKVGACLRTLSYQGERQE